MNFDIFEKWLLPVVIVLCLALGGGMTFATSLLHSSDSSSAVASPG
jgi:hypothetical protein